MQRLPSYILWSFVVRGKATALDILIEIEAHNIVKDENGPFFPNKRQQCKKKKKKTVIFRGSDGTRKTPLIHF